MDPTDYQKVKEIFNSVIEVEPAGRGAFLDEKCNGEGELRAEVERLLNSYDSEYLESPAIAGLASTVSRDRFATGDSVEHYTVVRKIGSGGMGDIYLAEDGKLGRQVAIKLLPDNFTEDVDRIRRFEQEARAASALNHPNILTIYEIGQTGTTRYIATEYIDGETLRSKLDQDNLPVNEALDIAVQCASALAAAHEAGVIHRDIKPENIMLRRDGLAKVLDFGLAKLVERKEIRVSHDALTERHLETAPGIIMGTVQYMSPEQTRGHATDARTDIWSLGVVCYEMLAGRSPFMGENTADLIAEIVKTHPAALSQSISDVPERLDEIVAKTLEKNPDKRYQTAKDLLIDLTRLKRKLDLEGEMERSTPGSRENTVEGVKITDPNRKPLESLSGTQYVLAGIKLHRGTSFWIFALIAALLLTSAFLARKYWRIADPNEARFAYATNIRLAAEALETSDLDSANQYLNATRPKKGEKDLRDFEWGYLARLHAERMASQPITLKNEGWVNSVAFSADGNTLATGSNDVHLWDVSTGQQKAAFDGHSKPVVSVIFSPDGTKLATGSFDLSAKLWDISGEKLLWTIDDPSVGIAMNRLAFSSAGQRLYSESAKRQIRSWDSSTGKEIHDNGSLHGLIHPFEFSPDGKYIAGQNQVEWAVDVKEIATGRTVTTLKRDFGLVTDVVFAPDSRSVVVKGSEDVAFLWELPSGKQIRKFDSVTCEPAFSPDGRSLAMCSKDVIRIWDLENFIERPLLRGHVGSVNAIAFSPDGLKLASGGEDNTAKIWNVPKNESRGILRAHAKSIGSLTFSPDGKTIVSASDDKTAKLWDVETEQERLTISSHSEKVITTAFSPDGLTLATAGDDRKIKLSDVVTGRERKSIDSPKPATVLTFSPDGKLLAAGHWFADDREVRLWDTASGTLVCSADARGAGAWNVEFSKDGKQFITATPPDNFAAATPTEENAIRFWETASCREISPAIYGEPATGFGVVFVDGKLRALKAINNGRSLKLLDIESGKELASFTGHESEGGRLAFSPNGKRLFSSDQDGQIKIWDVATGQELLSLKVNAGEASGLAFSPNGNVLAAAGDGGIIRLWRSASLE